MLKMPGVLNPAHRAMFNFINKLWEANPEMCGIIFVSFNLLMQFCSSYKIGN